MQILVERLVDSIHMVFVHLDRRRIIKIRDFVEKTYSDHVLEFREFPQFKAILDGSASQAGYDQFIANIYRTHQNSPQFLSFLYSLAPPASRERVKHNLLEEMGLEKEEGISHPEMFENVVRGANLELHIPLLQKLARETHKGLVTEPMLFGSLREVGFASLCEVTSFEFLLSRVADDIAVALKKHRNMKDDALMWFTHHGEVDIKHAEEGLDTIQDYSDYYEFDYEEAKDVAQMGLRENVFIKRYFAEISLDAPASGS